MKKFSAYLALLIALLVLPPLASAKQSWDFTSNSNPKAVALGANQIKMGSLSSSDWDTWKESDMEWDNTEKCWKIVFTANNGGFNFYFKCTNTSNQNYWYKGGDIHFSNGKATKEYAINENDGNGSSNYYCDGLTTGSQYIMKIKAHSGVTNCADMTIEPYTESTGGNTGNGGETGGTTTGTTVKLMGIGGDWDNGISKVADATTNQAVFTVDSWAANTQFKFKIGNTWYGKGDPDIENDTWYDYPNTAGGAPNFTLPSTATGKTVTFNVASDNGHFKASWDATSTGTGTGTGGGNQTTTGAYLMGIGGDWTTGLAPTRLSDDGNQAIFVVEKWASTYSFKIKLNGTWYGYGSTEPTLVNGVWFDYPVTGQYEDDNFTLPSSANGRTVTINVALDNAHFVCSWPTVDNPSTAATYPGGVPKQGVVFNADGSATFCLLAPMKHAVSISGSWNDYASSTLMNYQDYNDYRYFWTTIQNVDKSTWYTYYYTVDENYRVSDPYSPVVLDPEYDADINSGAWTDRPAYPASVADLKSYPDEEMTGKGSNGGTPSQKVRVSAVRGDIHDTYTWKVENFTPVDRGNMNIYELHVGDFNGTNGQRNGEGSFKKAEARLDYLKDLGINVIELMPVMEFDMNHNWGYDTNSHFAVDKQYGSPTDLKDFIDACHEKGIAVVLDMVFNHTTDNHPWKLMYAPGTSPFFNTSAPHDYSVHNDFNQNYPLVEPYYYDALSYWLTNYKVDGFRFDLVKGMGNNESYNNNYSGDAQNTSIVDRMKRLHAHMKTINPNVLHINEAFINYYDECALNTDGQLVWLHQCNEAQEYVAGDHSKNKFGNLDHTTAEANGRGSFGTINYAESHDEPWLGYIAKTTSNTNISGSLQSRMDRLSSYAAQMYVTHGPKMIWQFCEVGYDVEALAGSGYDRIGPKEVHWEFFDSPERQSLLNTYRSMMALRNQNPDMFVASVMPDFKDFGDNENARAVRVQAGEKEIILFVNPSTHEAKSYTFSDSSKNPLIWSGNYKVIASTKGYTPQVSSSYGSVTVSNIPANGFCVLATTNVAFSLESTTTPDPDPTPDPSTTVVVVGKFNNWDSTANTTTEINDNCAEIEVANYTNGTGDDAGFKIRINDTWYSSSTAVTNDGWVSLSDDQSLANMQLPESAEGKTVTFTIAVDTKSMKAAWIEGGTVTPPTPDPDKVVVYLEFGDGVKELWGGGDTFNVHVVGGAWPGATLVKDGALYKAEIDKTATEIIFNNGGNKCQSATLDVTPGHVYYVVNGTVTKDEYNNSVYPIHGEGSYPLFEGGKVYFNLGASDWTNCETPYIHFWGTAAVEAIDWPGKAMTPSTSLSGTMHRAASTGIFEYDLPAGVSGFMFTDGTTDGQKSDNVRHAMEQEMTYTVTGGATTGIENVAVEAEAAPVYYNLYGVRVANPANGIYIVVRGNKVTKELVK